MAKARASQGQGDRLSWKEQRENSRPTGQDYPLERTGRTGPAPADASIYQASDPGRRRQKAAARLAVIDDELMALLERWEAGDGLEARARTRHEQHVRNRIREPLRLNKPAWRTPLNSGRRQS